MIVVRLIGGLGNQMFQYAAAKSLAAHLSTDFCLDVRGFSHYNLRNYGLGKWNINARVATDKDLNRYPEGFRRFMEVISKFFDFKTRFYIERKFSYNHDFFYLKDNVHLNGYFQSQKYFYMIRNELLKDFSLHQGLNGNNKLIAELAQGSNSVMIHIRRGDYVSNPHSLNYHGICSLGYYENAIGLIKSRVDSPRFFVFSDDMDWVRSNLKLGDNVIYVEGNMVEPEIDIYLMSLCKHHIIANSSFSWWGAWLSQCDGIVIAPTPWFDNKTLSTVDLLPAKWVQLEK